MAAFKSRDEKAEWGLPCNQRADGSLWAGKGYRKALEGQFGTSVVRAIARAINSKRDDRCGRFWVDLEAKLVTMAVGESADNRYEQVRY